MQQKKRKMSPTTIAIGNDLLRHLAQRVHNVCVDAADTGERAGLDDVTVASILLTALASELARGAMAMNMDDGTFEELMARSMASARRIVKT